MSTGSRGREAVIWRLLWDERRRRESVLLQTSLPKLGGEAAHQEECREATFEKPRRGCSLEEPPQVRAKSRANVSGPNLAREFGALFLSFSALAIAYALKAFYSRAGANELLWILGPSVWLARFAGGIDLAYEQGAGYISHAHHMVVGPACAGVNFLIIAFLCLFFSFKRHFSSKLRWLLESLAIAYVGTIAANGLRIFVSAHLWDATMYREWVTPEQMHRLAGTVIYYASLLGLYFAMDGRFGARTPVTAPLLWYIGISLGVPLAGRVFAQGTPGFAAHAAWVIVITLALTAVKFLPSMLRNRIHLSP